MNTRITFLVRELRCVIGHEHTTLRNGRPVKVMKVARYADRLPSDLAFDIAARQLCRAVAALQPIDDPCRTKSAAARQSRVA